MKIGLILPLFLLSMVGYAQEPTVRAPAKPRSLDIKIDLGARLPEEFDWTAFFSKADQSTGGRWASAAAANEILRARIDALCAIYRQKLLKNKDQKALDAFDKMQKLWEQAAEAEISFVGSEYEGGSEAKVSFATHRFKVYLRRVKELIDLGHTAHFYE